MTHAAAPWVTASLAAAAWVTGLASHEAKPLRASLLFVRLTEPHGSQRIPSRTARSVYPLTAYTDWVYGSQRIPRRGDWRYPSAHAELLSGVITNRGDSRSIRMSSSVGPHPRETPHVTRWAPACFQHVLILGKQAGAHGRSPADSLISRALMATPQGRRVYCVACTA